jgi:hypothetical protein
MSELGHRHRHVRPLVGSELDATVVRPIEHGKIHTEKGNVNDKYAQR